MVEELTNIVCKECVEQVNKLAHFKRQSQKSLDLIKEASKAPIPKTQKGCQMCLKSQQKDGDFQNIKGTFMKNKVRSFSKSSTLLNQAYSYRLISWCTMNH